MAKIKIEYIKPNDSAASILAEFNSDSRNILLGANVISTISPGEVKILQTANKFIDNNLDVCGKILPCQNKIMNSNVTISSISVDHSIHLIYKSESGKLLGDAYEIATDGASYSPTINSYNGYTYASGGDPFIPTEDTTLNIMYNLNNYNINYHNHLGASIGSQQYNVEQAEFKMYVPEDLTKVYYGWYDNVELSGDKNYYFDPALVDIGDKNYYALEMANEYTGYTSNLTNKYNKDMVGRNSNTKFITIYLDQKINIRNNTSTLTYSLRMYDSKGDYWCTVPSGNCTAYASNPCKLTFNGTNIFSYSRNQSTYSSGASSTGWNGSYSAIYRSGTYVLSHDSLGNNAPELSWVLNARWNGSFGTGKGTLVITAIDQDYLK